VPHGDWIHRIELGYPHRRCLAMVRRRREAEGFAEPSDVVSVDVPQLVSGVVRQRELGTLAPNRQPGDFAETGKVMLGEEERCPDAAIVQSAISERLVQVKINAATVAVMDDEVPGTIAGPRMDAIDSLRAQCDEQALGLAGIDPDVQVRMLPGLFAHKRINGPASANAHSDVMRTHGCKQRVHGLRRHQVLGHALRVSSRRNCFGESFRKRRRPEDRGLRKARPRHERRT